MSNYSCQIADLLDLNHTVTAPWLAQLTYPWEALSGIGTWLQAALAQLQTDPGEYYAYAPDVWIARSVTVAPTATLIGPCLIGPETEIRPGAYLRGQVIIGSKCVIGNSTEIKNAILFDRVQVPHYNYVGDSILGYAAHLGAGAITSNVKGDRSCIKVRCADTCFETGRKKFGAILGDHAEVGCNAVLNPGTILGRNSQVYPLTSVRGYVPSHHICKQANQLIEKQPRE